MKPDPENQIHRKVITAPHAQLDPPSARLPDLQEDGDEQERGDEKPKDLRQGYRQTG